MNRIHATALVDPSAQIADDVEIGAFSIVGPKVTIGPGSRIGSHVVLTGRTTLGMNTRIFQLPSANFALSAGDPPRVAAKQSSATTTGSWPAFISLMIASWATTSLWLTMRPWRDT